MVTLQRRQAESYLRAVTRAQAAGEHGEYGRAKRVLRQQEEDKKAMARVLQGLGQGQGLGLGSGSSYVEGGHVPSSSHGLRSYSTPSSSSHPHHPHHSGSHALAPSSTAPTSSSVMAGLLTPLFVQPNNHNNNNQGSLGSPSSKNYTISRHPAYLDKVF